jgi:cbb3-type cytochrome oxidase maturation protein
MNVIYYLIPIAIVLIIIAVAIFFWAVKSDQFDDMERHGSSILFDDDESAEKHKKQPR